MSGVSGNNRHRGRPFESVVKDLLGEVEHFSKIVKECPDILEWTPNKDARKGLDELGGSIENFARSLRSLLGGNKFWMSETVTDRSGHRDLKHFKPDLEGLQRDVARVMDEEDQSGKYEGLKKARDQVDKMAQAFEKLREDMLKRILEQAKTTHANDKNSDIDLVVPPAPPATKEKEEPVREIDPYTPQKYFWLVFGGIIFRKALFTNILNIIGFTLILHFVPAFQHFQAMYPPPNTAANDPFREKAANCPIISLFKKPTTKSRISKTRSRTPSISIHPPDGLTAEAKAAASRTEAHVKDKDGPFVMTGATETTVDGTPRLVPML